MVSVVNLVLNGAGLALNNSLFRNITFYDQEMVLENENKAKETVADYILSKTGRIFYGIPFYHASPLDLSIEQTSKFCENPVENGAVITEHKVKMPVKISCSLAMPNFLSGIVIEEMKEYYNTSKKIIIKCVGGTYMNMILENLPTKMDNSNVDRPIYNVTFKEVILIEPETYDSNKNAENNNTRKVSVFSNLITQNIGAGDLSYF